MKLLSVVRDPVCVVILGQNPVVASVMSLNSKPLWKVDWAWHVIHKKHAIKWVGKMIQKIPKVLDVSIGDLENPSHMAPDPHVVDEAISVWLQDALGAQNGHRKLSTAQQWNRSYAPCIEYLPTICPKNHPNAGKYTIHGTYWETLQNYTGTIHSCINLPLFHVCLIGGHNKKCQKISIIWHWIKIK